ncbi:MAG TPA: hypothetical protein VFL82_05250 [Thermomicrobiales bacterium]|nr:hypothetical protein [Thermomicrobiales bacterium]
MNSIIVADMMIQAERELLPTLAARGSQVEESINSHSRPANERSQRLRQTAGTLLVKIGTRLAATPGPHASFDGDSMPAVPLRS